MKPRNLMSLCVILLVTSTIPISMISFYHVDKIDIAIEHNPAETSLAMTGELLYEVNYNYSGNQYPNEVLETTDGNYVLVGYTESASPSIDVWFQKVNISGHVLWNRTFDGAGRSDQGICVVETIDGGFLLANSHNNGSDHYDTWVIRTNSTGHHLWNCTYIFDNHDFPTELIGLDNGDFLIYGKVNTGSPNGPPDFYMLRANSTGYHLWNITLGGVGGENAFQALKHSSGSFIGSGWYQHPEDDNLDAHLFAVDANGNLLWNKTYGLPGNNEAAYALQETNSGDIIFSGWTETAENDNDIWVVRTDANGNYLWNKTFGGPEFERADTMTAYSSGGFTLSCRTMSYGAAGVDILVIKIDEDGNRLWNFTYGTHDHDYVKDIIPVSSGGYCFISYKANSTSGITYSTDFRILPEPIWIGEPIEQAIEENTLFLYDLEATSAASVTWAINDTKFSISNDGVIENSTILAVGQYDLEVTVTDGLGNILTASFVLSVNAETPTNTDDTSVTEPPPENYETLIIVMVIALLSIVIIGVVLRSRKK